MTIAYLREEFRWNYTVGFLMIIGAVFLYLISGNFINNNSTNKISGKGDEMFKREIWKKVNAGLIGLLSLGILQSGCVVSKNKYSELLKKVEEQQKTINNLMGEKGDLRNEYNRLLEEKLALKDSYDTAVREKTILKEEYSKLLEEKIALSARHQKLLSEKENLEKTVKELKDKLVLITPIQ